MTPYLSIVIPAYNEAQRLPATLEAIKKFVEAQDYLTEVVVVDDGSRDQTVAVVKDFAQHFPALRLIENTKNKGKGGVVCQGMLEAKGSYRLFMDADSSTPISELAKLLTFAHDYPVVIGSRHLEKGSIKTKRSLKRRLISWGSNWLIRHTVLPGIRDTQCGFKLFKAEAAEAIFKRQAVSGWLFDVEILSIAQQLGFAIKEVPIEWYDASNSTMRAAQAVSRSLKELQRIRTNIREGTYGKATAR